MARGRFVHGGRLTTRGVVDAVTGAPIVSGDALLGDDGATVLMGDDGTTNLIQD